jgi:outer membrane protein OmpA-like peptidoglycan-associated protein
MSAGLRRLVTCAMIAGTVALATDAQNSRAEELIKADQILNALVPGAAATRSLSGSRPETTQIPEQTNFLAPMRNRAANSLASDERQKLATFANDKPSIDVSIKFDYNSDKIGPAATPAIQEVGKALVRPKLAGGTFMVAGHTDGTGSDLYNQKLSERRAEAVKTYLVTHYQIPAANLLAVGYGKTTLKNVDNPFAPENRRVQIVNMTPTAAAGQ